jgi:hypothetical protein
MTDKRNIVIKVSYPVAGKAAGNSAPQVITEWNVKRIALAVGVLVLILASLIFAINGNTDNTDSDNGAMLVAAPEQTISEAREYEIKIPALSDQSTKKNNAVAKSNKEPDKKNKQTADIATKDAVKNQPNKDITKEYGYSKAKHNVSRALLTYKINNKEPTGEIARIVNISRKKPTWIYYFTELKAMKGSKVYHEWLKNGVVVSKQELTIPDDTWRTSSRKLLSDADKGKWSVRLVDKNNRLLNEKNFKVE